MKTLAEMIGENIRARREAKGMNRSQLTHAVRPSRYDCALAAAWETGKNTPSAYYLCALADVFGCSVDELLGR